MTRRTAGILLLALAAAVVVLIVVHRSGSSQGRRRSRLFLRVTPVAPVPLSPAPGAPPVTATETVRVTLFFPGQEDAKLRPEERDIPKPADAAAYLKALFAELSRGPTQNAFLPALPRRIRLRNAFLLPDGVAVLDLAVDSGLAFGSQEELTIVASLVDTVLQNVADISHVRILVNGEPAETLSGHVDLTQPLAYLRHELAS